MNERLARTIQAVGDSLVDQVRNNLTPDLLKPGMGGDNPMAGHCYVASEAIYHLMGGPQSGLKPVRLRMPDGVVHWWLQDQDGNVIDPTHDQFDHEIPYEQGRPGGFLTREPSKRAQEVMRRVTGSTTASIHVAPVNFEVGQRFFPAPAFSFLYYDGDLWVTRGHHPDILAYLKHTEPAYYAEVRNASRDGSAAWGWYEAGTEAREDKDHIAFWSANVPKHVDVAKDEFGTSYQAQQAARRYIIPQLDNIQGLLDSDMPVGESPDAWMDNVQLSGYEQQREAGTQPIELMLSADWRGKFQHELHQDPGRLAFAYHDGTLYIGVFHRDIIRNMQMEGLPTRDHTIYGWIDPKGDGKEWSTVTDWGDQDNSLLPDLQAFFQQYPPSVVMNYAKTGQMTPDPTWEWEGYDDPEAYGTWQHQSQWKRGEALPYADPTYDSPIENPVNYNFLPLEDTERSAWDGLSSQQKQWWHRKANKLNNYSKWNSRVNGQDLYALYNRYQGNCAYCGQPMGSDVSWDHVIPLGQGGVNSIDNLLPCHRECNQQMNEWDVSIQKGRRMSNDSNVTFVQTRDDHPHGGGTPFIYIPDQNHLYIGTSDDFHRIVIKNNPDLRGFIHEDEYIDGSGYVAGRVDDSGAVEFYMAEEPIVQHNKQAVLALLQQAWPDLKAVYDNDPLPEYRSPIIDENYYEGQTFFEKHQLHTSAWIKRGMEIEHVPDDGIIWDFHRMPWIYNADNDTLYISEWGAYHRPILQYLKAGVEHAGQLNSHSLFGGYTLADGSWEWSDSGNEVNVPHSVEQQITQFSEEEARYQREQQEEMDREFNSLGRFIAAGLSPYRFIMLKDGTELNDAGDGSITDHRDLARKNGISWKDVADVGIYEGNRRRSLLDFAPNVPKFYEYDFDRDDSTPRKYLQQINDEQRTSSLQWLDVPDNGFGGQGGAERYAGVYDPRNDNLYMGKNPNVSHANIIRHVRGLAEDMTDDGFGYSGKDNLEHLFYCEFFPYNGFWEILHAGRNTNGEEEMNRTLADEALHTLMQQSGHTAADAGPNVLRVKTPRTKLRGVYGMPFTYFPNQDIVTLADSHTFHTRMWKNLPGELHNEIKTNRDQLINGHIVPVRGQNVGGVQFYTETQDVDPQVMDRLYNTLEPYARGLPFDEEEYVEPEKHDPNQLSLIASGYAGTAWAFDTNTGQFAFGDWHKDCWKQLGAKPNDCVFGTINQGKPTLMRGESEADANLSASDIAIIRRLVAQGYRNQVTSAWEDIPDGYRPLCPECNNELVSRYKQNAGWVGECSNCGNTWGLPLAKDRDWLTDTQQPANWTAPGENSDPVGMSVFDETEAKVAKLQIVHMEVPPDDEHPERAFALSRQTGDLYMSDTGASHYDLFKAMNVSLKELHDGLWAVGWLEGTRPEYGEAWGKSPATPNDEEKRQIEQQLRAKIGAEMPNLDFPSGHSWFTSWLYIPAFDMLLIENNPHVNHGELLRKFKTEHYEQYREFREQHLPIVAGLITEDHDENYDDDEHHMAIVPVYSDEFSNSEVQLDTPSIETAIKRVHDWALENTDWGELNEAPASYNENSWGTDQGEPPDELRPYLEDGTMWSHVAADWSEMAYSSPVLRFKDGSDLIGLAGQSHRGLLKQMWEKGYDINDVVAEGYANSDGVVTWMDKAAPNTDMLRGEHGGQIPKPINYNPTGWTLSSASSVMIRDEPDPDNYIFTYSPGADHLIVGNRKWNHTRYGQVGHYIAGGYNRVRGWGSQGLWFYDDSAATLEGSRQVSPEIRAKIVAALESNGFKADTDDVTERSQVNDETVRSHKTAGIQAFVYDPVTGEYHFGFWHRSIYNQTGLDPAKTIKGVRHNENYAEVYPNEQLPFDWPFYQKVEDDARKITPPPTEDDLDDEREQFPVSHRASSLLTHADPVAGIEYVKTPDDEYGGDNGDNIYTVMYDPKTGVLYVNTTEGSSHANMLRVLKMKGLSARDSGLEAGWLLTGENEYIDPQDENGRWALAYHAEIPAALMDEAWEKMASLSNSNYRDTNRDMLSRYDEYPPDPVVIVPPVHPSNTAPNTLVPPSTGVRPGFALAQIGAHVKGLDELGRSWTSTMLRQSQGLTDGSPRASSDRSLTPTVLTHAPRYATRVDPHQTCPSRVPPAHRQNPISGSHSISNLSNITGQMDTQTAESLSALVPPKTGDTNLQGRAARDSLTPKVQHVHEVESPPGPSFMPGSDAIIYDPENDDLYVCRNGVHRTILKQYPELTDRTNHLGFYETYPHEADWFQIAWDQETSRDWLAMARTEYTHWLANARTPAAREAGDGDDWTEVPPDDAVTYGHDALIYDVDNDHLYICPDGHHRAILREFPYLKKVLMNCGIYECNYESAHSFGIFPDALGTNNATFDGNNMQRADAIYMEWYKQNRMQDRYTRTSHTSAASETRIVDVPTSGMHPYGDIPFIYMEPQDTLYICTASGHHRDILDYIKHHDPDNWAAFQDPMATDPIVYGEYVPGDANYPDTIHLFDTETGREIPWSDATHLLPQHIIDYINQKWPIYDESHIASDRPELHSWLYVPEHGGLLIDNSQNFTNHRHLLQQKGLSLKDLRDGKLGPFVAGQIWFRPDMHGETYGDFSFFSDYVNYAEDTSGEGDDSDYYNYEVDPYSQLSQRATARLAEWFQQAYPGMKLQESGLDGEVVVPGDSRYGYSSTPNRDLGVDHYASTKWLESTAEDQDWGVGHEWISFVYANDNLWLSHTLIHPQILSRIGLKPKDLKEGDTAAGWLHSGINEASIYSWDAEEMNEETSGDANAMRLVEQNFPGIKFVEQDQFFADASDFDYQHDKEAAPQVKLQYVPAVSPADAEYGHQIPLIFDQRTGTLYYGDEGGMHRDLINAAAGSAMDSDMIQHSLLKHELQAGLASGPGKVTWYGSPGTVVEQFATQMTYNWYDQARQAAAPPMTNIVRVPINHEPYTPYLVAWIYDWVQQKLYWGAVGSGHNDLLRYMKRQEGDSTALAVGSDEQFSAGAFNVQTGQAVAYGGRHIDNDFLNAIDQVGTQLEFQTTSRIDPVQVQFLGRPSRNMIWVWHVPDNTLVFGNMFQTYHRTIMREMEPNVPIKDTAKLFLLGELDNLQTPDGDQVEISDRSGEPYPSPSVVEAVTRAYLENGGSELPPGHPGLWSEQTPRSSKYYHFVEEQNAESRWGGLPFIVTPEGRLYVSDDPEEWHRALARRVGLSSFEIGTAGVIYPDGTFTILWDTIGGDVDELQDLLTDEVPDSVWDGEGHNLHEGTHDRMLDRWNEHHDAAPFVWIRGKTWIGAPSGTHRQLGRDNPEMWEQLRDETQGLPFDKAVRGDLPIYVGRIFPDGEVVEWSDKRVPDHVINDIRSVEAMRDDPNVGITYEPPPEAEPVSPSQQDEQMSLFSGASPGSMEWDGSWFYFPDTDELFATDPKDKSSDHRTLMNTVQDLRSRAREEPFVAGWYTYPEHLQWDDDYNRLPRDPNQGIKVVPWGSDWLNNQNGMSEPIDPEGHDDESVVPRVVELSKEKFPGLHFTG